MSNFPFSARARATTLVALAAMLAACADGGPPSVARVVVAGVASAADSLTVGDRRTLTAALADSKGSAIVGRQVAWSSSDVAVAVVDAAGMVSAVAVGVATITAESEGVRGQVAISVRRRPVAQIAPERSADTLWLGRSRALRAEARAADGSALRDRAIAWSSADTSLVSIAVGPDGSAVARGVALGATLLTLRSEAATVTVPVVVVPVPVARLTLGPVPDSILLGRTATLHLAAQAPDGTPVAAAELAGRSVTWLSDRTNVLAVSGLPDAIGGSPSGYSATVRAVTSGNATITAAIGDGLVRATIRAARPPVAELLFFPGSVTLVPGRSATVVAAAFDASGQAVAGAPLVYSLADGAGVLRVTQTASTDGTPTARLDALAPGTATVAVMADGARATLEVRVVSAGAALRAYPSTITAAPGAQGRLSVSMMDTSGTFVSIGDGTYRSTDAAVATVDANGYVTMVAPGTATIVATARGFQANVSVTVAAAPPSTFRIDVRPLGTVPAPILDAARQAASRWERVITTALPAQRVDLAAGECWPGLPAVHEVIDGLVVYLSARRIDGPRNVLAEAGPCAQRDAEFGGLPIVGSMTIDLDDVATLTGATGAQAMDVLTHEIGHVLGIGTLWRGGSPAGNLMRSLAADPRYIGAGASAASERLGLSQTTSEGAAIEDEGGFGTALGHWRERVYLGELMTGWINPSPNPLSIVTVHALRDLGYQVTETGADLVSPMTIAGGAAFTARGVRAGPSFQRAGAGSAPIRLVERLVTPRVVVRRDGGSAPRR